MADSTVVLQQSLGEKDGGRPGGTDTRGVHSFFYGHLSQGHIGTQMGKTGIELPTFWLDDNRAIPLSHMQRLGRVRGGQRDDKSPGCLGPSQRGGGPAVPTPHLTLKGDRFAGLAKVRSLDQFAPKCGNMDEKEGGKLITSHVC
ncbi:unnamed protein product [Pleuronectes platessa]|uniref:Uncharacterized protein n=1 Tax=Pleuronectes platessa TaxID=8262 RepID=A0A9N7VZW8_PLEPL|nr:unnamed protein product [Pleuronectes platessa]